MRARARTPRNKLTNLHSKLDSNTGQHHLPAPLDSTNNTTGQQHWPPALVSTIGRHHWPRPLAPCSKHVDDGDDDDDDADDDYDDEDGDGDDDLTIHPCRCVHVCARRAIHLPSWPANWTATIGSTTGQHHWLALITPLASSTGHHHWSAPLAGNIGQDPWQHITCLLYTSPSPRD